MTTYTPLTDAEARDIASQHFAERSSKTTQQDQPTMVLVGAQPGAGKSSAANMAKNELGERGGYIHVDADVMRAKIPLHGSQPTSEQTQGDAGKLAILLRNQAIQERRNIVEEGTFRNADGAAQFVKDMQARGYKVEMLAVATSREESVLGIHQRYEGLHRAGDANPRFVSESYHDMAMQGFDATVARTAGQLDRARVVDRSGTTLFDSAGIGNAQANAAEALAAGRKVSDEKLAAITKAWENVGAMAEARGAPESYLDSVRGHIQRTEDMQKERIHTHAMGRLEDNIGALTHDPRFAQHTDSELAKASYFRGFHEKASEFRGAAPDFPKYDTTVSDRDTLKQLPDVAELRNYEAARPLQSQERQNDGNSL